MIEPLLSVRKSGSCVGHNFNAGRIVHVIRNGECVGPRFTAALCGSRPGRLSAGWNEDCPALTPTCERCAARVAAMRFHLFAINRRSHWEVQLTDKKLPPLTLTEARTMASKLTPHPRRMIEIREAYE